MRHRGGNVSPPAGLAVLERLEPRVLLSAAVTATPFFALYEPPAEATPAAGSSAPMGLAPDIIRRAYGIDQVVFGSIIGDGTGQTIAIIDAYDAPTIVADLATFNSTFGLPECVLTIIPQEGATTLPDPDTANQGWSWAVETSLDVEWAHAIAPGAGILLVEANSNLMTDLFAAVDTARKYPGVSVISMSWGLGETYGNQTSYDTYFNTPSGHTGITFVAASGDDGAYDYQTTHKDVIYPAASSHVLAVGGTTLATGADGSYVSEVGWGNGNQSGYLGGSGGGRSSYVRQPAFQTAVVPTSMAKSGRRNWRTVPDVAIDADPASGVAVIDSWDFGVDTPWWQVGGTSLSAPMWAGLIAIADQGRVLAGEQTLDGPTQTLSMIYSLPAEDFHDITGGNNGNAAVAGYDLVTGRGTPIADVLVLGLVGTTWPQPAMTAPAGGFIAGRGWTVQLAATVIDTSSTVTSVEFFDGAASLGSGAFDGGAWTYAWDTTGAAVATHSITAKAADSAGLTTFSAAVSVVVRFPGDGDGNGVVDGLDYGIWQNGYQHTNPTFDTGDFNGNGVVDGLDYNLWQNNYNAAPGGQAAADRPAGSAGAGGLLRSLGPAAAPYLSQTRGTPAAPPSPTGIAPDAVTTPPSAARVPVAGILHGAAPLPSAAAARRAWPRAVDRTPAAGAKTDPSLSPDGGIDLLAAPALLVPLEA